MKDYKEYTIREYANGMKSWYINGAKLTEEQWNACTRVIGQATNNAG